MTQITSSEKGERQASTSWGLLIARREFRCDVCSVENEYVCELHYQREVHVVMLICLDCLALMMEVSSGYAVQKMVYAWGYNRRAGAAIRAERAAAKAE